MSRGGGDLAAKVAPLRVEVDGLSERLSALAEETHYEDLEHALLGLRIVDHALEETEEHAGLGGEIPHTPDAALLARATELAARLGELRSDAGNFLSDHPSEDLETAVTALEIASGSLHEVVERYEEDR